MRAVRSAPPTVQPEGGSTLRMARISTVPPICKARLLCGALVLANAWAAAPAAPGIESCPKIADDKQRLACFDREFARLQQPSKAAEPPPAALVAPTAAATQLTPEQRMGLTSEQILQRQNSPSAPDLKELTVKIQEVWANSTGRGLFSLENGQIWRQVEPDPNFRVKPGDTVHITKGALGSYFMSVNAHMSTRVTRTK